MNHYKKTFHNPTSAQRAKAETRSKIPTWGSTLRPFLVMTTLFFFTIFFFGCGRDDFQKIPFPSEKKFTFYDND